jgi:hypothetical protein
LINLAPKKVFQHRSVALNVWTKKTVKREKKNGATTLTVITHIITTLSIHTIVSTMTQLNAMTLSQKAFSILTLTNHENIQHNNAQHDYTHP